MPTRSEDFAGLTVAMITPFRDGQVDIEAFQRLVQCQIEAGTTCLCPVGTTGESPTLHPEHERVIAAAVEAAAGRIKIMAGTGSNSTDEALRLTRWAAKNEADAALVVAPYYNKPTQEGFYQHYKALAQAVDIPICIYNIPGRTAKNRGGHDRAHGRTAQHHHGQRGHRLHGPGLPDPRPPTSRSSAATTA